MVNTPIPHSLKSEAKKAAKILRDFTVPSAKSGPDKLIPAGIFAKAKGLAIITVFKAGFLVTARGGSGIVIARVQDSLDFASGWSAPSAIGLAGLGGGFEIGVEVTDFVIILNTRAAVDAFSKGGNLTLGGNFTIAAGPLGRNIEGDISLRSAAAIYTYSKTKGIFAGISVEGSALIERKDANRKFYGQDIRAHQILQGQVEIPDECSALYEVMREHQKMAAKAALGMAKDKLLEGVSKSKSKSEWNLSSIKSTFSSSSSKTKSSSTATHNLDASSSSSSYQPQSNSSSPKMKTAGGSSFSSSSSVMSSFSSRRKRTDSDSFNTGSPQSQQRQLKSRSVIGLHHIGLTTSDSSSPSYSKAGKQFVVADHPFQGQLSCDLSFKAGDRIEVTWSSDYQEDWWEGVTRKGQRGIFPANYCHLIQSLRGRE